MVSRGTAVTCDLRLLILVTLTSYCQQNSSSSLDCTGFGRGFGRSLAQRQGGFLLLYRFGLLGEAVGPLLQSFLLFRHRATASTTAAETKTKSPVATPTIFSTAITFQVGLRSDAGLN